MLARIDDLSEAKKIDPKFVGYLKARDPASQVKSRLVGAMEQVENEVKDRIESQRPELVIEDPVQEDILNKVKQNFRDYLQTVEKECLDSNALEPADDRELSSLAQDRDLHLQDPSQDYLDER